MASLKRYQWVCPGSCWIGTCGLLRSQIDIPVSSSAVTWYAARFINPKLERKRNNNKKINAVQTPDWERKYLFKEQKRLSF